MIVRPWVSHDQAVLVTAIAATGSAGAELPGQCLPQLVASVLGSALAAVRAACVCVETMAENRRDDLLPVLRLDAVADLLEAVGRRGADADRSGLGTAAALLRSIGAQWDATEAAGLSPWDRQHRWDDAPALADVCVSVVRVAARQRGRSMRDRPRVSDRLRAAARFLADIEPARVELLSAAMDLAWAAGMVPPIEPPAGVGDTDAVIRALATGIALAATVADPDHPSTFHEWEARSRAH